MFSTAIEFELYGQGKLNDIFQQPSQLREKFRGQNHINRRYRCLKIGGIAGRYRQRCRNYKDLYRDVTPVGKAFQVESSLVDVLSSPLNFPGSLMWIVA